MCGSWKWHCVLHAILSQKFGCSCQNDGKRHCARMHDSMSKCKETAAHTTFSPSMGEPQSLSWDANQQPAALVDRQEALLHMRRTVYNNNNGNLHSTLTNISAMCCVFATQMLTNRQESLLHVRTVCCVFATGSGTEKPNRTSAKIPGRRRPRYVVIIS